ncbi:DedA family protein [Actinomadura kijaniata]|uniref:DedA family protein n=1 Tax=Actinomadura kijaniata TaxID=46161 RepID=UPI0008362117|nr:VTT domain-containing protein [Actinomadura kijaniata]
MIDFFRGLPLWLGVSVAVAIIFVRGMVYYWIGRAVGPRIYTSKLGRRIGEGRLRRVEAMVARRGVLAIVGAHWVAGIRHAIPICAGVTRMPLPRFMLGSVIGAALWTPPWIVGGYAVVWGWLKVFRESPPAAAALVVAVAALVTGLVVLRRRRRGGAPEETVAQDQPGSSSTPVG